MPNAMSLPREVVAGRLLFLTRRCSQRELLMRPDAFTTNAFLFCMLVAARITKVNVVLVCAMSNHYHAVIHDRDGQCPRFLMHFHRLFACVMNARHGRAENFWSSAQTSVIHLIDREALMEKLVYVATNPVKAHLVASHAAWPGLNTLSALLEHRTLEADRPAQFFCKYAEARRSLLHRPQLPQHALIGDHEAFLRELRERVEAEESAVRADVARLGKRFVGADKQSQPVVVKTKETKLKRRRTFVAVCPDAMKRARIAYREFLAAYLAARVRWREGNRDAVFPPGTYWLRVHARVRVADER
jgi:hypothetical protein